MQQDFSNQVILKITIKPEKISLVKTRKCEQRKKITERVSNAEIF